MRGQLGIFITIIIIVLLFLNIGLFIPKPKVRPIYINNSELRQEALLHGLKAVPATWNKAKRLVIDKNDPLSIEKINLGRLLFVDPILSKDKTISCATCHILQEGGDDNRPTAIGYHGRKNPFHLNTPTVLNAALEKMLLWSGKSPNVQNQAQNPLQASFEMDMTQKEVVKRLKKESFYVKAFKSAFKSHKITFINTTKAIGAYERTLLTRGAFDRFLDGNNSAISMQAKKGLFLFMRLGCKSCHTGMSVGGQSMQRFPLKRYDGFIVPKSVFINGMPVFSKFQFQSPRFKNSPFPFPDTGGFHGRGGQFKFKVPTLRNVARTAPYFHNGEVKQLKDAIRIMARHQLGIVLTKKQIKQIVAFLKTLSGNVVNYKF